MHIKTYSGHYSRDDLKAKIDSTFDGRWSAVDEGEDLLLKWERLFPRTLKRDTWKTPMRRYMFVSRVRLKIFSDRVETSIKFNLMIYAYILYVIYTLIFLLRGEFSVQKEGLIVAIGILFVFVDRFTLTKELDQIFS